MIEQLYHLYMRDEVVALLNKLNKDFYATIAQSFDATRQTSWSGWDKLKSYINHQNLKSVLDIGCGNGRYLEFSRAQGFTGQYTGLDSDNSLLSFARSRYSNATFTNFDLHVDRLPTQKFDLQVLFGVMHHLPGQDIRNNLLGQLKNNLADDGCIVFSVWDFAQHPRYTRRFIDWHEIGLNDSDIEKGDYLLDWQRSQHALRYCHYYTHEEVLKLLEINDLKMQATFFADGRDDNLNRYYVVKGA